MLIPYGSWTSPLSLESLVSETISLSLPLPSGGDLYWLESRPADKGRSVIVRYHKGKCTDVLGKEFSARSKVHEYGGGSFLPVGDRIFFSQDKDQRVYSIDHLGAPVAVTEDSSMRYADFAFDPKKEILYAVREEQKGKEVLNTLIKIDLEEGKSEVIAEGNDFYSSPRLSPTGRHLAYVSWNLPQMPWDGCTLMLHEIKKDGSLTDGVVVAGGKNESIFQPAFSPDGTLYFVSDRSGYWNLYRYHKGKVETLLPMEADFGTPQWLFGFSQFAFVPNNGSYDIVAAYTEDGIDRLGYLSLKDFSFTPIDTPYTSIRYVQADEKYVYFVGASPYAPQSIVQMEIATKKTEVLRRSRENSLDESFVSVGQKVEFTTADGQKAYGFFYPPQNPNIQGPSNERPPLIVKCHGGPTSSVTNALNLETQFWTTRGIAVFDVNYRGSAGYGKAYRDALNGNWGIADVNDCCDGALHLAHLGLVDRNRMAIKGGSAGGFIAIAAATFRDVFQGAVSYFGICDLEKMTDQSEKFEGRYHETLIGPYPELKKIYRERSAIHFVDNVQIPVLLLHGSEDHIVVPAQSEDFYEALKKKGKEVEYYLFDKEGHGFKKAENIRKALLHECALYSRIFGASIP